MGYLRQSADVEEAEKREREYEQGKTEFSAEEDAHVIGDCIKLLAASVLCFIALMSVIGCRSDLPFSLVTPGLVGLGLSYAAPIVSSLSNFLTSFTEIENEMVSTERVLQYMDIPQEKLQGSQSLHPEWPFQGHIEHFEPVLREDIQKLK